MAARRTGIYEMGSNRFPLEQILHIAVDAMGGDAGVAVTVPAVLAALDADPALHIHLFGDAAAIQSQLQQRSVTRLNLIHCSSSVAMDEKPAAALRHKAESSMALAIQSHQQGNSGAMVSAGNTAALVAFGLQILDSLPGVNRPALCCAMPHRTGRTWMLDMGATLEPEPDQLVQFARMGSCLAQINEGLERPRVGLLNVGSENGKGTSAVRDLAAQLESCADIYYCGFAEGVDICSGRFDVIVCEGFAGNVALKAAEGVSSYIGELVADFRRDGWVSRFAMLLLRKRLQALGRRIDPAEFNGAPLLGLGGLIIKSRGGTNTRGFATAIALAAEMARSNVLARMEEYMGV